MKGTAPDMEIAENLAIASKRGVRRRFVRGVRKSDREGYRELLKTLDLGLEDRLSTKVGLLSGGQRQAVTLLMATMNKPKLLLLDEHTAALDPKNSGKGVGDHGAYSYGKPSDDVDDHPQYERRNHLR